jgi:hypothetical protein
MQAVTFQPTKVSATKGALEEKGYRNHVHRSGLFPRAIRNTANVTSDYVKNPDMCRGF